MQRMLTCEGRFPQLRALISEALEVFGPVTGEAQLFEFWRLIEDDVHAADPSDNYFLPRDELRPRPSTNDVYSLVPLLARSTETSDDLVRSYVSGSHDPRQSDLLTCFFPSGHFCEQELGEVRTSFGIGPSAGIVADSPYSLELWRTHDERQVHALTVGFWFRYRNDDRVMVIDQIQEGRTPLGPIEGVGRVGLDMAERFAKESGFDEMWLYSASRHPMFYAHPDRRRRMMSEFEEVYDQSAIASGFVGSRSTFYMKRVE